MSFFFVSSSNWAFLGPWHGPRPLTRLGKSTNLSNWLLRWRFSRRSYLLRQLTMKLNSRGEVKESWPRAKSFLFVELRGMQKDQFDHALKGWFCSCCFPLFSSKPIHHVYVSKQPRHVSFMDHNTKPSFLLQQQWQNMSRYEYAQIYFKFLPRGTSRQDSYFYSWSHIGGTLHINIPHIFWPDPWFGRDSWSSATRNLTTSEQWAVCVWTMTSCA